MPQRRSKQPQNKQEAAKRRAEAAAQKGVEAENKRIDTIVAQKQAAVMEEAARRDDLIAQGQTPIYGPVATFPPPPAPEEREPIGRADPSAPPEPTP